VRPVAVGGVDEIDADRAPDAAAASPSAMAGGPDVAAVGGHAHCAETHAVDAEIAELSGSGRRGWIPVLIHAKDRAMNGTLVAVRSRALKRTERRFNLFGLCNGPQIRFMRFEALRVFFLRLSSGHRVGMITSWPGFQFTGVARRIWRSIAVIEQAAVPSSKLRPALHR